MKISQIFAATTIAAAVLATPALASAEGFYGTAVLGWSFQAEDSEPYGDNLAVDSTFPNTFDSGDGGVGGIGLGYRINDRYRIEARFSARRGEFNSGEFGAGARAGEEFVLNGSLRSKTLTVEAFYDFPIKSSFKPYLKAGVGISRNKYSARLGGSGVAGFFDSLDGTVDGFYDNYADRSSNEFSWNIGLGANKAISESVNLIAEYQYISLGDGSTAQDDFTDGFRVDAAAHELLIGLRIGF